MQMLIDPRDWLKALLVGFLLLAASPAGAELLPRAESIATPAESEALKDLTGFEPGEQTEADLVRLDAVLTKLRGATPLRGLVQALRAQILFDADRFDEARDAVEESIRLLPGYSGPLLLATRVEAYSDRGLEAVSYLLRASLVDPQFVRAIPDYELNNILSRVPQNGGSELYTQMAERLFAIGWRGEGLILRSTLAAHVIAARLDAGSAESARPLLPHLVDPRDVQWLLMQKRYERFWPALAEWGGEVQERLWPHFLTELGARWAVSREHDDARAYLGALAVANRHQRIVTEFLPLFSNLEEERDYNIQWLAAPLAASLAQLGRWDEVDALFSKALKTWPAGSDANALNLLANRGKFRYLRGDFAGAVGDLRAAIADGRRRGGEVSVHALAPMHQVLACSLHRLGRRAEADRSIPVVLQHSSSSNIAKLYLCLGRREDARKALLAGLAIWPQQDDVVRFVQLENGPPLPNDVARAAASSRRSLAEDPEILAAVAPYGRVLPYAAGAGANVAGKPGN
jgi:tetratricopeptide (TPR) repeat protein